jgi:hypothetical protein
VLGEGVIARDIKRSLPRVDDRPTVFANVASVANRRSTAARCTGLSSRARYAVMIAMSASISEPPALAKRR